jgi:hypothetical protein
MQALLGPGGSRRLVACDLLTFNLVDGTAMYFTSFDRDVTYNGQVYSSGTRIQIGKPGLAKITWKRGVNVDRLTVTVAPQPSDPGDVFLTFLQAVVAGAFDGCTVTLLRAFNPVASAVQTQTIAGQSQQVIVPTSPVQVDATLGVITLFVGLWSSAAVDRAIIRFTVAAVAELLNVQIPRHQFTTQCRWGELFESGCGNLRTVTDGAMTSGSAVLTSNTLAFSGTPDIGGTGGQLATNDLGRPIRVYGAGAGGADLITSIASVQSATQATLAAAAGTTVSGAEVTIGLLQANFALGGVAAAGSTPTSVVSAALTQPPGYFDQGQIVFTSGLNTGIARTIMKYLPADAAGPSTSGLLAGAQRYRANSSYEAAVLADLPTAYWRLGQDGSDYSGNGYDLAVSGLTFGQPGALNGDSMTSAFFGGSSLVNTGPNVQTNMPDPGSGPGAMAALSFEFWLNTSYAQTQGIFDTNPNGDLLPGSYRQAPGTQALRSFGYGYGGFEWNPAAPLLQIPFPTNQWCHVVVLFFGGNTINVFINGRLAGGTSAAGDGFYVWTGLRLGMTSFNYRGFNGSGGYEWDVAGSITDYTAPKFVGYYNCWFNGYLQEFAVYNYMLNFFQIQSHYQIGIQGPNTSGNASVTLAQALPYAPAPGDGFTIYPGCDRSAFTCRHRFGNFNSFGGFPFVPNTETAI